MELPKKTGVYLVYRGDELLYVGKAKNIKARIDQHKQAKPIWINKFNKIDFMLTETEREAIILECDLVKQLKPKYNILLKDDKTFPMIAISYDEDFPRVFLTRERSVKKRKYFGPYLNPRQARKLVSTLQKIFPYRSCRGTKPGREINPCLDYHLGLCGAPCVNYINKKNYSKNIKQIEAVLKGETAEIKADLTEQMNQAALKEEFEKAALIRDQLFSLEEIEGSVFQETDLDIFIFLKTGVFLNKVRASKIIATRHFPIDATGPEASLFLMQYFEQTPKEILVAGVDKNDLSDFEKVYPNKINWQPKTTKKKLLGNAFKTASLKETPTDTSLNDLAALEETLNLTIKTIEGYDVSNLMGQDGYVAKVVFKDGRANKKAYRVFKTNQDKPDDYLALKNALKKRTAQGNPPDLILIDGGKGQLSVAQKALKDFILKEKIIAIAKKEETIFGINGEIKMTPDALRLLINVRDEAHRFSLKHHRGARSKKMTASALEGIPGLGAKRIKQIEAAIPDLNKASAEDFENIPGISSKMALTIYKALSER